MLNNKHILKTLSNTIYFASIFGMIFSTVNFFATSNFQSFNFMVKNHGPIDENELCGDNIIPGPKRPPFGNK